MESKDLETEFEEVLISSYCRMVDELYLSRLRTYLKVTGTEPSGLLTGREDLSPDAQLMLNVLKEYSHLLNVEQLWESYLIWLEKPGNASFELYDFLYYAVGGATFYMAADTLRAHASSIAKRIWREPSLFIGRPQLRRPLLSESLTSMVRLLHDYSEWSELPQILRDEFIQTFTTWYTQVYALN